MLRVSRPQWSKSVYSAAQIGIQAEKFSRKAELFRVKHTYSPEELQEH